MAKTDISPSSVTAPDDIRVVKDNSTGAVAIVLGPVAVDALDLFLDSLGTVDDIVDGDPSSGFLAAAALMTRMRALLRAV